VHLKVQSVPSITVQRKECQYLVWQHSARLATAAVSSMLIHDCLNSVPHRSAHSSGSTMSGRSGVVMLLCSRRVACCASEQAGVMACMQQLHSGSGTLSLLQNQACMSGQPMQCPNTLLRPGPEWMTLMAAAPSATTQRPP